MSRSESPESRAGRAAARYRDLGLSPLPSSRSDKKPALPEVTRYRSEPLPDSYFDAWPTPNVQLLLGASAYGRQKILVVDCDGERAKTVWGEMMAANGFTHENWVVNTGGGGEHWYFRVPSGVESVPTGIVWGLWDTWGKDGKGGWSKHSEVKVLGDGALSVAPPSVHVDTGRKYEFSDGWRNPVGLPVLAEAPEWLLSMPRLTAPSFGPTDRRAQRPGVYGPSNRQEVLDAVEDKAAMAASWGLRFACVGPNRAGWMSCHAVRGKDDNASAGFNCLTGVYRDARTGETHSLFDLAVELGAFGDWLSCVKWIESVHLSPYRQVLALEKGAKRE